MKEVVFEKATITGVEHKIGNGNVTSKIKVSALFTAKAAQAMEAGWVLFDRETLVKDGFKSVELDVEMKNINLVFDVPNLGNPLTLNSEMATAFKVLRRGDGKKKAKALSIQFKIQHSGSPFELLEHMIRVGGHVGTLTITPRQQEMFEAKPAEATTSQDTPIPFHQKRWRPRKKSIEEKEAETAFAVSRHNERAAGRGPIPSDPNTPEWRCADEIADGVPRFIAKETGA